jgi:hypothetical protein
LSRRKIRFPERQCFIELEIFIDAFDGPALGHPVPVEPAARHILGTVSEGERSVGSTERNPFFP